MPKFLEEQLKREYPNNPHAVFGTLNAIGAMRGNKITAKGRAMEKKHVADQRKVVPSSGHHPHRNLGKYLHPKKGQ